VQQHQTTEEPEPAEPFGRPTAPPSYKKFVFHSEVLPTESLYLYRGEDFARRLTQPGAESRAPASNVLNHTSSTHTLTTHLPSESDA